ncbi:formamidopyrimidine-DNA glycosylase [Gordoniibacillus kamchatkensis]|uniref:Formamidopyrimidine-DNA glycosylase n=1 Tax=Gordoniibacillus kamchatkensis TaxID=1590651 RepID=A0ABR5AH57_9BACL|nr:DNA-formamidopyrimidine glycosylase family protein [Paenibacillus sp. VKM B-2647]KIL40163.1 formamidopyrimidine-DNA glycosylase [Paenibacillus sp. VKM B-2647]
MPELPEMEHYREALIPLVAGKTITAADVERERTINVPVGVFTQSVVGQQIVTVKRRAKHLLFPLANGYTLHLHLMLDGSMFYGTPEQKQNRTAQVTLAFQDGRMLYFHGLRLGYLHLQTEVELAEVLDTLAPDPFDPQLTPGLFADRLRGKRATLKAALTDQDAVVSGIGNCYSDEICFAAGLLPTRRTTGLNDEEANRLYGAMRSVLRAATDGGGYMEMPLYAGDTLTGAFNERCAVYDRGGEPCVRCGSPIVFATVNSRKCFYCTTCQQ